MAFEDFFAHVRRKCISAPPNPVLLEVLRRGADLFIFSPKAKSNPVVLEYFAQLDVNVESLVRTQLSSGSWSDFETNQKLHVEFVASYWARPFLLAVSYANSLSRHYASPKVLASIDAALRQGRPFTSPNYPRWTNWWDQ